MGFDLYILKKKAVMIHLPGNKREMAYFLQRVIPNALAQDAHELVDLAIVEAHREWEVRNRWPRLVVQVEDERPPRPGSAIFQWTTNPRVYCFDHELLEPVGYLGGKKLGGFFFRTVREQQELNDIETARKIDDGQAHVFRDYWRGVTFETGAEYLEYRRGMTGGWCRRQGRETFKPHPRLSKILTLIQLIQSKGPGASSADIQYLTCLKRKAHQLGHSLS